MAERKAFAVILDAGSATFSIILLRLFLEIFNFDRTTNWKTLAVDSFVACLLLLISFIAVHLIAEKPSIATAAVGSLLGSSFLILYILIRGIVLDWPYLKDNLDKLYVRHFDTTFFMLWLIVCVLSFVAVISARAIKGFFQIKLR